MTFTKPSRCRRLRRIRAHTRYHSSNHVQAKASSKKNDGGMRYKSRRKGRSSRTTRSKLACLSKRRRISVRSKVYRGGTSHCDAGDLANAFSKLFSKLQIFKIQGYGKYDQIVSLAGSMGLFTTKKHLLKRFGGFTVNYLEKKKIDDPLCKVYENPDQLYEFEDKLEATLTYTKADRNAGTLRDDQLVGREKRERIFEYKYLRKSMDGTDGMFLHVEMSRRNYDNRLQKPQNTDHNPGLFEFRGLSDEEWKELQAWLDAQACIVRYHTKGHFPICQNPNPLFTNPKQALEHLNSIQKRSQIPNKPYYPVRPNVLSEDFIRAVESHNPSADVSKLTIQKRQKYVAGPSLYHHIGNNFLSADEGWDQLYFFDGFVITEQFPAIIYQKKKRNAIVKEERAYRFVFTKDGGPFTEGHYLVVRTSDRYNKNTLMSDEHQHLEDYRYNLFEFKNIDADTWTAIKKALAERASTLGITRPYSLGTDLVIEDEDFTVNYPAKSSVM